MKATLSPLVSVRIFPILLCAAFLLGVPYVRVAAGASWDGEQSTYPELTLNPLGSQSTLNPMDSVQRSLRVTSPLPEPPLGNYRSSLQLCGERQGNAFGTSSSSLFGDNRQNSSGRFGSCPNPQSISGSLSQQTSIFNRQLEYRDNRGTTATIEPQRNSFTPRWDYESNDGTRGTISKQPYFFNDSYEYRDNSGTRATLRESTFGFTPTYEYSDNHGTRGTLRKQTHSFTPTWEYTDNKGTRITIRKDTFGFTPRYEVNGRVCNGGLPPLGALPLWEEQQEQEQK